MLNLQNPIFSDSCKLFLLLFTKKITYCYNLENQYTIVFLLSFKVEESYMLHFVGHKKNIYLYNA